MPYLFLLFVLMPIIEIAVLIQVGGAIGGWTTIGIVILTAIVGTAMLRQQGLSTLAKAQQRMGAGEMPARQMLEGLILLVGGVLLLTPGFITDALGFFCLVPFTRGWMAEKLAARSLGGVGVFVGGVQVPGSSGGRSSAGSRQSSGKSDRRTPGQGTPNRPDSGSADPEVIDGDYHRID